MSKRDDIELRRDVTRRQRWISAFLLAMLGLQALPVAHEMAGGHESLWPFLPWGMFRASSQPPVEATRERIFAFTADGARRVRADDTGFYFYAFRYFYQTPIAGGDSAAARDLARLLARRSGVQVREIAAEVTVFTLEAEGYRKSTSVRRFPMGAP